MIGHCHILSSGPTAEVEGPQCVADLAISVGIQLLYCLIILEVILMELDFHSLLFYIVIKSSNLSSILLL